MTEQFNYAQFTALPLAKIDDAPDGLVWKLRQVKDSDHYAMAEIRKAAALRKMVRRFAAKWLAGQKSKTADLFVSYLKSI